MKYSLSEECAGLTIWDHESSLRDLHFIISDICERSPLLAGEDTVLGLAYDLRKAFNGERRIHKGKDYNDNPTTIYGEDIIWPVILVQSKLLRNALAFMPSGRNHHQEIYKLEYIVEIALKEEFGALADDIITVWENLVTNNLAERLRSRGAMFSFWSPKQRRELTLEVMKSFDPMYEYEHSELSEAEFEEMETEEWPNVKWTPRNG